MRLAYLRADIGKGTVGGSYTHTEGLVRALRQLGHEVLVLTNKTVPCPERYRWMPEFGSVFYDRLFTREAQEVLSGWKPDVIYQRHSQFSIAGAVLKDTVDVPFILEYNGSEVWVKKNWGRMRFLKQYLEETEQLQVDAADRIGVVSHVLANQLHSDKVFLNPNGVDTDMFHPAVSAGQVREKHGLRKMVCGYVGTFGQWHGVDIIIQAARNIDAQFLMIGDGKLRRECVKKATSNVIFTGSVRHEEMPQYLAACDILLCPSLNNADGTEFFGSPTKLFEYMAMGKPIVASNVGQIRHILENNQDALLVEPNDVVGLSGAIHRFMWDPRKRYQLGLNAGRKALQYSWKANAQRIIDEVNKCGGSF